MKISISKNKFYSTLQTISKAVSSISPQPSLRGIKIEVTNEQLIVTGSDADISIREVILPNEDNHLNILEEGAILIDVKYLLEVVRKIDAEDLEIEIIDGNFVRFFGGHAQFKINGMDPNNYTKINFNPLDKSFSISSGDLSEIINQTIFAVSNKDTRPVLTGVNFKARENMLYCTATNSYRLSKKIYPLPLDFEFELTVPSKILNEMKSYLAIETDKEVIIGIDDRQIQFIVDDITFQSRLLEGSYPETDKLIPKDFSSTLLINKNDLLRATDRTLFIKTDNLINNRLQCSKDEIILSNRNQEIGEVEEPLVGTYEGDDLDICYSANYIIDALRVLKSNEVKISFTSQLKPFIITDPDDDSVIELVLPLRTYN